MAASLKRDADFIKFAFETAWNGSYLKSWHEMLPTVVRSDSHDQRPLSPGWKKTEHRSGLMKPFERIESSKKVRKQ